MKTIFLDNSGRATSEVSLSFRRGGSKGPNMRPVPHTGQLMGSAETKRQPFRFSDSSVPSPYQDAFTKQTLTKNSSVRTSENIRAHRFPNENIYLCHYSPGTTLGILHVESATVLWFKHRETWEEGRKWGAEGSGETSLGGREHLMAYQGLSPG